MTVDGGPRDSLYDAEADRERLAGQVSRLHAFDSRVIEPVMTGLLGRRGVNPVRVLDAGCADGQMVLAHFSHLHRLRVEGVDKNAAAIARAQASVLGDERFEFTCAELSEVSLPVAAYDLVLCSYVLPHVANPKALVDKLWDALAPGGSLLLRAGDDGWKAVRPTPPDWGALLELSARYFPMSDRQSGRKISGYLRSLMPKPWGVQPHFWIESTKHMDACARREFFRTYYGFRRRYLSPAMNTAPAPVVERIARALDAGELFFADARPLAFVTHSIFVATKP